MADKLGLSEIGDKLDCGFCNKKVKKSDKGIKCEICDLWFHISCEKMDGEVYDFLRKRAGDRVHWYCTKCDKVATKLWTSVLKIQERVEKLEDRLKNVDEIEKRLEKIENKLETIAEKELKMNVEVEPKWAEIVSRNIDDKMIYIAEDIGKVKAEMKETQEAIAEFEDKKKRKNNIIIFNLPECQQEDGKAREKEDREFCGSLFDEVLQIGYEDGFIKKIIRLGKREKGVVRPMLVELSENIKNLVMENAGKLGKAKGKYKGITLSHDMTKKEREQCKELLQEAKVKNEDSGDYIFKVRGLPGAMKLIKLKKYH